MILLVCAVMTWVIATFWNTSAIGPVVLPVALTRTPAGDCDIVF